MSWLNSLNNIKGQISNLAQEILAEDEHEESLPVAFEETSRLLELEQLCLSKDDEVSFGLKRFDSR